VLGCALIPDAEFDRLFAELQALEAQYPQLATADSPTCGSAEHRAPDLRRCPCRADAVAEQRAQRGDASDSMRGMRELLAKAGQPTPVVTYACELKFDGLAVNCAT